MAEVGRAAIDLRSLYAALSALTRRARVQAAIDLGGAFSLAAVVVFALAVALWKLDEKDAAQPVLLLAALLPLLGALAGALRRVSQLRMAERLDRALGTSDLIASAWSFARIADADRTPFMLACMHQAARQASHARASHALPIHAPATLRPLLLLVLMVGALSLVRLPSQPHHASASQVVSKPRLLHPDDLTAFAEELAPLLIGTQGEPPVDQSANQLNAILEGLKDNRLDRAEALRQLRELEQRLRDDLRDGDAALRDALQELGEQLGNDATAKSVADALKEGDADKARAELEQLAQALHTQRPLSKPNTKLARALERAAKPPSLLRKKQRTLDKLERDAEQREQAQRQLDRLRRELSEASKSLGQQQAQQAAKHLQRAAEEMDKAAQQQLKEQRRKQLKERVEQLREMISKQQKPGAEGKPRPGAGRKGRLTLDGFVRAAQGDEKGDGPPMLDENTKAPTPGTESIQVAAPLAGEGGKPESLTEPTARSTKLVDTRAQGEAREGPSRSQVIREAGQEGFATRSYQRVHGDYRRHAESVLERDHVPGGYRFYVRRYFQLIRPREVSDE